MELKRANKDEIKQKAQRFFRSQRWKNLLVFLVFVGLASGFWLLQYYQQKFEIDLTIPVQYKNIPKDVVLNHSLPRQIDIKVSDKGTTLFHYLYKEKLQTIEWDLEEITYKKGSYIIDRTHLNQKINELLLSSTRLISFYPETIIVESSPLEKKQLPVFLNGNIEVEHGFIFTDSILISPSTVFVYGDKKTLDTLQQIKTIPFKSKPINKSLDISLDLQVPIGVHLSEEKANIKVDVEVSTEKTFTLPVTCYNQPRNLSVLFFPSSVEVVCPIALSKYTLFKESELEIRIDYQELVGNNSKIHLYLTKKPQWLNNYRIVPDNVEYLVEQKIDL